MEINNKKERNLLQYIVTILFLIGLVGAECIDIKDNPEVIIFRYSQNNQSPCVADIHSKDFFIENKTIEFRYFYMDDPAGVIKSNKGFYVLETGLERYSHYGFDINISCGENKNILSIERSSIPCSIKQNGRVLVC